MPDRVVKEGINFQAIGLILLMVALPVLWIKWMDSSLLHRKPVSGRYALSTPVSYFTPTPLAGGGFSIDTTRGDNMVGFLSALSATPTPESTATVTPVPTVTLSPGRVAGWWYPDLSRVGGTVDTSGYTRVEVPAHISYYWPEYGGINCDATCDDLADGSDWHGQEGLVLACPSEYPFGTIFQIGGTFWVCRDRGQAIVTNADGTIWLDVLYPYMPFKGVAWGSVLTVGVWQP